MQCQNPKINRITTKFLETVFENEKTIEKKGWKALANLGRNE